MAVEVFVATSIRDLATYEVAVYDDAEKYHIDPNGYLHLVHPGLGNVASYAPSAWLGVRQRP